jgi:superfamily II DNA or RNA helicase
VRTGFVGVDFSEEERDRYLIISETLISLRKKLISDWGCQSSPFSAFLDDVLKLLGGPMAGGMLANKWLSKWSERRELLAETPAKQQALLQMLPAIEAASKTLIFTQSIASAEAIAEGLRTVGTAVEAHHSQITRVEQAAILERFALGDCRVLVSVRTLEEGIDVPDADLAIIVATSKQRRQMVQRMGRVMRRKSDGRDARFILLYVRFTDEDPRFGAEEGFIEELVGVARESDLFDLPEEAERFVDFLDPSRR